MDYQPRFTPPELVPALLAAWRMTSVGWPVRTSAPAGVDPFSRYGRLMRAAALFATHKPGQTEAGAYKDLDGLVGPAVCLTA